MSRYAMRKCQRCGKAKYPGEFPKEKNTCKQCINLRARQIKGGKKPRVTNERIFKFHDRRPSERPGPNGWTTIHIETKGKDE